MTNLLHFFGGWWGNWVTSNPPFVWGGGGVVAHMLDPGSNAPSFGGLGFLRFFERVASLLDFFGGVGRTWLLPALHSFFGCGGGASM